MLGGHVCSWHKTAEMTARSDAWCRHRSGPQIWHWGTRTRVAPCAAGCAVGWDHIGRAALHSAWYAEIFSAAVSESARTMVVCARSASLLKDCPTAQAVRLSTKMSRSCNVRGAASRTSSGRLWPNCWDHRRAAGEREGL